MSRKRVAWITAGASAALTATLLVTGLLVIRSTWFHDRVRERIVSTIETATGGRVEVGRFQFDWRRLRAGIERLVIHGTEPEGKPPLFQAQSIAAGLKIISILRRDVDIEYVDIAGPQVYLAIGPDGSTNIPRPKIRGNGRNPIETILDASIGRFSIVNGVLEVEARGRVPFEAHGRNLQARFDYDLAGPRYLGGIGVQLADLRIRNYAPTDVDLEAKLSLEKNRINITSATVQTGDSKLEFSGAVEELNSPAASFQYTAVVSQADVARFLKTKLLERGAARVAGNARWSGGRNFAVDGNLNAYDLEYRDRYVHLPGFRADGVLTAGPEGVEVRALRLSGFYVRPGKRVPIDGRVAAVAIGLRRVDFRGVGLAGLGGAFRGQASLENLDHFRASGEISGFQARRVVALYSDQPLPWDGRASGPVQVQASIRTNKGIKISGELSVTPEAGSAPVTGHITATYDSRGRLLDLGHSTLALPSSRAGFSGAIGRELRVRLETHDLNDILPAVGLKAGSVPVVFQKGLAVFDGTVSGPLDDAHISGSLKASGFSYAGRVFDSLSANVAASRTNARLDGAVLARGPLQASFEGMVALSNWKPDPGSDIFGGGTLRNAPAGELAAIAGWSGAPLSGTANITAQLQGSVAKPILQATVDVNKGALQNEPFDRFTGKVRYAGNLLELSGGRIVAGEKAVAVNGTYRHAPGTYGAGQLSFDVSSNSMPLDQIRTLAETRPGIKGEVKGTARGSIEIRPARKDERGFSLTSLQADISAAGLQYTGQNLGNAHFTAESEAGQLRARLDAKVGDSEVQGAGSWRLEGDYPGSATIKFSRLDLARLKGWVSPRTAGAVPFAGSAEGEIRVDGPIARPQALRASLIMPRMEVSPAPSNALAVQGAPLVIRNSGPVAASVANSVVTIESAHFVGRATDITVSGKAALDRQNGLDLRINGRLDLGVLQDFSADVASSGNVNVNATVRGALDAPQVGGRMEVQEASLSIEGFPNGLSNGNGVILFSGDRATIQSLKGESGGGVVELSGFAGYSRGQAIFHLDLSGQEVRVRYPEGISTVSNAKLNLSGSTERSILTGSISILRTGVNVQSDFSSVLARSAEPIETPAVRTGILGGMSLDVQIETAPDIEVRSALTQDIAAEANLRLRGTATNPVLQGRVNIIQGQVLFLGSRYDISQGSINFYNLAKIEPVLNIDLETKAKGIDITLTLSGPLKKLNMTPRSDPPLPFNDIVSLLATGQAPTSDPALLAQRSASSLPWQQMGASALLGQAIASPVAGRLQRFFGVSRLRIDPTLPGVEYNPQARFTVEQQVTPEITFTYITVVNSSNPQVVRVEWDFSKQWSVVALREENGQFGLDFYYKRQF